MAIEIAKRKFIATLGAGAVSPLVARARPTNRIRLIGVLMGFAESDPTARSMVEAFRGALPKLGWTEGSNVRIEVRWGGYGADRIKMLAKELVDLRPERRDPRSDHTGDRCASPARRGQFQSYS